jgi:hypothetical protein
MKRPVFWGTLGENDASKIALMRLERFLQPRIDKERNDVAANELAGVLRDFGARDGGELAGGRGTG